jgi:hypothetical protein
MDALGRLAPDGIDVLRGNKTGKMVVKIAD